MCICIHVLRCVVYVVELTYHLATVRCHVWLALGICNGSIVILRWFSYITSSSSVVSSTLLSMQLLAISFIANSSLDL